MNNKVLITVGQDDGCSAQQNFVNAIPAGVPQRDRVRLDGALAS